MASTPAPPLAADDLLHLLIQLSLLLTLALCLGRLASRFGMPAVAGELLAGVLLGPSVLGLAAPALAHGIFPAEQIHLLDAVGQFGILLLVGVAGIQLDIQLLHRRRLTAARISLAGLLIPLVLGVGLGYLVSTSLAPAGGERLVSAAFLGVAMCVSAVPVIAKTLSDMGLLHRDIGQLTLAAGVFDDAVGWFLLSLVSAMATVGLQTGRLAVSALSLVGFIVFAVVLGRPLVRWTLRAAARSSEAGATVTATVIIIVVGSSITHGLHLEAVFGAFVAGVLVACTDPQVGTRLAALRTVVTWVLAPIFLAAAGLRMDLTALGDLQVLGAAAIVLAVAVLGKFAGAYLGARSSGLTSWEGLALGAGMNARGVTEVVVAMVGLQLGILNTAGYTIIVLVAIVTSLMAPPILRWAMAHVQDTPQERLRLAQQDAIWSDSHQRSVV